MDEGTVRIGDTTPGDKDMRGYYVRVVAAARAAATTTGGGTMSDFPLTDGDWWFNLRTQQVEQGQGDPNGERLGPYATREEAAGALGRMHERTEAFDKQDDD
jgi:hypothetical protein